MYPQDTRGNTRRLLGMGDDGIYSDAWGRQKVITDYSQFHGLFTYYVPNEQWLEYFNGVERTKTNATSSNGELKLISGAGTTTLLAREHPRYQPNRGQLYSNSLWIDNATKTNGKLYAVIRTFRDSTVFEEKVQISGAYFNALDLSKGQIYDIQMQWRGVGAITFFIGQKEVAYINNIGNNNNLITSNPALPAGFECINDGTIRFGMFSPQCGVFFEWVFNIPQQTQLRCGCVDISSEGGNDIRRFYQPVIGNEIAVSNNVILAVRVPETLNGQLNTRDFNINAFKVQSDKKGTVFIYVTRDVTALTTSGTWVVASGGDLEIFAPTTIAGTTFDIAKAELFEVMPIEANLVSIAQNPDIVSIKKLLSHGDYLVMVGVGSVATMRGIIQLGEEI